MQLISSLYDKFSSSYVAILIDEYDHPILHTLHNRELALKIRAVMKSFSCVIKAQAKFVRFVFVTGVSAFSKSGLSSGLNNLKNLTLSEEFFDICGYTDVEIDQYFTGYVKLWADRRKDSFEEIRENLKVWYNGYCFKEDTARIYSPFSLICALDSKELQNFWFESATPQLLLEEIVKAERQEECHLLYQEGFYGTVSLLQTFEIESIPLTALLFQMGYLTIDSYDAESKIYQLKYPNLEVKTALHKHLMIVLTKIAPSPFDSLLTKLWSFRNLYG